MGRLAAILLHVDNVIYFLAGAAVMSFGIIGLADPSLLVNILSYIPVVEQLSLIMDIASVAFGPAVYMTSIGAVAVVLSIVGGVGIGGGKLKRRHSLVIVYGVCTLLFMLFDIALIMFYAIEPYYIQPKVESSMKKTLESTFKPVSIDGTGAITLPPNGSENAWVRMQFEQSCCGVSNYTDYGSFTWENTFTINSVPVTADVPPSCCVMKFQRQTPDNVDDFVNLAECMDTPPIYTNNVGCSTYVMQQITRYNFIYVCVAAGMTGLQAIILALVMGALSEPLGKIGIV